MLPEGMPDMEIIRSPEAVNRAIDAMVEKIESLIADEGAWQLIGIANGGVPLARELIARLKSKGISLPFGVLNVSFHRDDIGSRPIIAPKFPSHVPAPIDRCNVILIDDICHSGRTIRAALDELFEHGRPKWVRCITLVDRGNRVLPIQPDFAPIHLEIESTMTLKLVIDHEDCLGNRLWVRPRSTEVKESPIS